MTTVFKYLINDNNIPVFFGTDILHNSLVQVAKSAGFLVISYDLVSCRFVAKCFGESTTLKIESNPIVDKVIIEKFLNNTAKLAVFTENKCEIKKTG
ncbi:MAG: hypothetical protein C0412_10080 [Flavobacterium sp.]|nr:hypothetical protein [Flavobacterium sp.]